jgi:hypothetical protein
MELNPVALFAVLFVLITMPILFVLCSHMNTTEAITPRQNDYSMRHIIERELKRQKQLWRQDSSRSMKLLFLL